MEVDMRSRLRFLAAAALAPGAVGLPATPAPASARTFTVPVEYHKLDNGLRVGPSRDTTTPKAVAAVYSNIGFRLA